ncbi:hypothetical protein G5V58_00315 [Nocardioides anomalus]|uniref:CARDB domain-containing protein n=1 Tax=Nocardioides anomalus TaxID=2712223 RepID=A0A6G6W885_9ACTN|nr:CARDB domain-containing protein [Nocardioides anomalus]QIG41419.1 hypothetical protein G5V58_00315 [Nocardioides anomalus]
MTKTRTLLALAAAAALLAPTGAVAKPHQHQVPDLAVMDVAVNRTSAAPGETLTATATVANRGKARAKAATVTYYLTQNDVRSPGDAARASSRVAKLKPRKKLPSGPVTITIPPGTVAGGYHVVACLSGKSTGTKGNDCRASATIAVSAVLRGTLAGTLTVSKGSSRDESGPGTISTESSSDVVTINLGVDVDESRAGDWQQFKATSSRYDYSGTHSRISQDTYCRDETQDSSVGSGAIVQNGDPYYDMLYAQFARTDHSQISVLVNLPYSRSGTRTTTPMDDRFGCDATSTTTGPTRAVATVDLRLTQTRREGDRITYRVTTAVGAESVPEWKTWSGEVTLTLR